MGKKILSSLMISTILTSLVSGVLILKESPTPSLGVYAAETKKEEKPIDIPKEEPEIPKEEEPVEKPEEKPVDKPVDKPAESEPDNTVTGEESTSATILYPSAPEETSIYFGKTFATVEFKATIIANTRIYSGPSVPSEKNDFTEVGSLKMDSTVDVIGISTNGYLRIEYDGGQVGFIESKFAKK